MISNEDIAKELESLLNKVPAKSDKRNLVIYTGQAGAKAINDVMKDEFDRGRRELEAQQRMQMNVEYIKQLANKIGKLPTIARYHKLCKMINSSDDEIRNMAIKIIQGL